MAEIRIKICGITSTEDALVAAELGADAIGLVFAPSKRKISPQKAREIVKSLPPFISVIGVFADTPLKEVLEIVEFVQLDAVQLHGDEPPHYCSKIPRKVIKRIDPLEKNLEERVQLFQEVSAFLFDPGKGDGLTFDWDKISHLNCRKIIAGGLNPENVATAIIRSKPYGVDVSSGVEIHPGKKDPEKLKKFIQAVKKIQEELK